jgi:hypothetical protein
LTLLSPRLERPANWARAWRAEGHRLRSLRAQWTLLVIAVAGAVLIGAAQVLALPPDAVSERVAHAAGSGAEISPFFVGLGAALFTAADLSSRQFGLTLLQLDNRLLVFGAKVAVLVGTAFSSGVGVILLVAPLAITVGGWPLTSSLLDWMMLPALHVLFALFGASIGMVARSVVAAVFAYLAAVWALPLAVAVVGIWAPWMSGPVLQFAPVTLTAAMLETDLRMAAFARFGVLDAALLVLGGVRVVGWRIR